MKSLMLVVAAFVFCVPSFAQQNTGRISGAVTDQSGGAIAGASVTVTDVARGTARPLIADAAGEYAAPNLTPGIYTVHAEFKGFTTVERQNVAVTAGSDIRVDLSLQPGEQTQTVTVTESLPVINTTNSQTGGTLENELLSNLPLNGRNFRWLVSLVPGVMLLPGEGITSQSTNGGGTDIGNFMIDGLYAQSTYAKQSSVGGAGEAGDTTILPLDAIQEVNLVVNPKAEYGWDPGLTVSVGLKSGTNNLHGSAYAYGRDEALDARNAFADTRQPVEFEQYGGTLGGPIKKNKLFFFGSYEGERFVVGNTFQNTVPTTSLISGDTTNSIPAAIAAINTLHAQGSPPAGVTTLNQLSLNLAGCDYTSANIHSQNVATVALACTKNAQGATSLFGNSGPSATATQNLSNVAGTDDGLIKIDFHPSDHHAINGEYFQGQYGATYVSGAGVIVQPYWRQFLSVGTKLGAAIWIWTPNSSWLNEARFGVDKDFRPVSTIECNGADPLGRGATLGANGGPDYTAAYQFTSNAPVCGFPTVTLNGFTGQLGFGNNRLDFESDYQGADSLSYTHGKHQFKFGVDIRAESFMGVKTQDQQKGTIAFGGSGAAGFAGATSLESFLVGIASSEQIKLGDPVRTVSWIQTGLFAQDDWRILSRLTINAGLRFEIYGAPGDKDGLLGNFDPTQPTGMVQNNQAWPHQNLIAPRLGLVYDLTGNGRTIVRVGGSLAYVAPNLQGMLSGDDFSSEPTGATLFDVHGASMQGPGNIRNLFTATAPTTSGSPNNIANGNFIPWGAAPTLLFPSNNTQVCGNGLAPVAPIAPGAGAFNPAACVGDGGRLNYQFTQMGTWTLDFQRAFTNSLSVDIGYVGTHSSDVKAILDINQPLPGSTGSSNEILRRPFYAAANNPYGDAFPWFAKISYIAPAGVTNYNALQVHLTERATHGLTFNVNYTLAHALGINYGPGSVAVMDSTRPKLDYGNMNSDVRDHATLSFNYAIPEKKLPGQLLQGWQINGSVNLVSALPFNSIDSTDDVSGTGEKLDRWTLAGGPPSAFSDLGGAGNVPCFGIQGSTFQKAGCTIVATAASLPTACLNAAAAEPLSPLGTGVAIAPTTAGLPAGAPATGPNTGTFNLYKYGCYMENGAVIVPPAQGTFGLMGLNALRGKGIRLVNFSVTKGFKFKERYGAEFRVEMFNLFNRTQYYTPSNNLGAPGTFGEAPSTPDVGKNNPVVGSGGPRAIQLALKLNF